VTRIVFTGGARSGKSAAATELARSRAAQGHAVHVVVFGREDEADAEFSARIARHRADRPDGFITIEASDSSSWLTRVPDDAFVLLDCVGTLLGRVMEEAYRECAAADISAAAADRLPDGFEDAVAARFGVVISALCARPGDTIIVTNEVGDGVVPTYASGRLFRDLLGSANRRLVADADAAYLCVAGRMVDLTTCSTGVPWPTD